MKKLVKLSSLIVVFFVFGISNIASAALVNPLCPDPDVPSECIDSFPKFLTKIGDFLFTLGFLVVPIVIIVAALLLVVSRGDAQKVDRARKMLLWGVIGLVVMFAAKAMASVIKAILG